MTVSSLQQLDFFLMSVLAGVGVGFFYNFLAALRRKTGEKLALLSDFTFWVVAAAAVIIMGIKFNDGGIRGYQILGIGTGFTGHFLVLNRISEKVGAFFAGLLLKLMYPIAFILRGIVLYIREILNKTVRFFTKIAKIRQKIALRAKTRKKIQKKSKKML